MNWQNIWENRDKISHNYNDTTLQKLIKYDGFDSGAGSLNHEQWMEMIKGFWSLASVNEKSNVLEVGCGAGAFLYAMKKLANFNAYGIDYSKALIKIARMHIPDGNFFISEANKLPDFKNNFDLIIFHGVVHYFPNFEYLEKSLIECKKYLRNNGTLYLMDICDKDKEKDYHIHRRQAYPDPKEYDLKYKELPHLFVDKVQLLETLDNEELCDTKFFPHFIKDYGNSEFRFNIQIKRS